MLKHIYLFINQAMFDMNLVAVLKDQASFSTSANLLLTYSPFYLANIIFR